MSSTWMANEQVSKVFKVWRHMQNRSFDAPFPIQTLFWEKRNNLENFFGIPGRSRPNECWAGQKQSNHVSRWLRACITE